MRSEIDCVDASANCASGVATAVLLSLRFLSCRAYDTDRSGFLSPEEFAAALVKLNFVGVQREVRLCVCARVLAV